MDPALDALLTSIRDLESRVAILEDLATAAANGTGEKVAAPERVVCPHAEIAALFHRYCPTMPKVLKIDGNRANAVRTRWVAAGGAKEGRGLQWFEQLFKRAGASSFLNGSSGKWTACCFDWLLKPANCTKVLEGTYDDRRVPATAPARAGDAVQDEMFQAFAAQREAAGTT